jgi:hypothetical protein
MTTTKPVRWLQVLCLACDGEGTFDVCEEERAAAYRRGPASCACEACEGSGKVEIDLRSEDGAVGRHKGAAGLEAALFALSFVAWHSDGHDLWPVTARDVAELAADGVAVEMFKGVGPGLAKAAPVAPAAALDLVAAE